MKNLQFLFDDGKLLQESFEEASSNIYRQSWVIMNEFIDRVLRWVLYNCIVNMFIPMRKVSHRIDQVISENIIHPPNPSFYSAALLC